MIRKLSLFLISRVLPLTTVDNSSVSPNRLTVHSDSPYDKQTIPATHFKQRGFLWPFLSSCSCSCSASSPVWRCFGVFAGSIFGLPIHQEESSTQEPTVCSNPAAQTIALLVAIPPLLRRTAGQRLLRYVPGARSKAAEERPSAYTLKGSPVPTRSARTLASLTLESMLSLEMASMAMLSASRRFAVSPAAPRSVLDVTLPCIV